MHRITINLFFWKEIKKIRVFPQFAEFSHRLLSGSVQRDSAVVLLESAMLTENAPPSHLFLIKTVFIKLVRLKNTPIRFEAKVLAQRDSSAQQLTHSGSVFDGLQRPVGWFSLNNA